MLLPARRPDVEQAGLRAAHDDQDLAGYGAHGGGQTSGIHDIDERPPAGGIDARPRRQGAGAAGLQGEHTHARVPERAGEVPERLVERLLVARLEPEVGADLGEQALGLGAGAPQAVAAAAHDHVEIGARRQGLQRGAMAEDGILRQVEQDARPGPGLGVEHRDHALHLVGGADREHLAGPVDEAPVALLRALGRQRHAVRLARQRHHVAGRMLERGGGMAGHAGGPLLLCPLLCDGARYAEPARCSGNPDGEGEGQCPHPHGHSPPRALAHGPVA